MHMQEIQMCVRASRKTTMLQSVLHASADEVQMYVHANRMTTMLHGVLHAHTGDPDVHTAH